jgi:nucleotide-binding universal stress UspA family protein
MAHANAPVAVLLDGTSRDTPALHAAALLLVAAPQPTSVVLLRVIPAASQRRVDDLPPLVDLAERAAAVELRDLTSGLQCASVHCEVLVGDDPARELLAWLDSHRPTAIVLTGRERRGWWHGPDRITRALLRKSPAPVIVVPPDATAAGSLDRSTVLAGATR